MNHTELAVSRFENRNGASSWRVSGVSHGVRIRKNFKTREEAAAEKSVLEIKALQRTSGLRTAVWLDRRGLTCPKRRYRNLIAERLDAIRAHGDPACYNAYFPRYLLKCLQDWFEHYGDDLYGELKHIRNALDQVLASARFATRVRDDARQLDVRCSEPV